MSEATLRFPSELLKGAQSFAIDFGSSVVKVSFISPDDSNDGYSTIICVPFSRANFSQALEFIKSSCNIPKASGEALPEYILTGVGVYQYEQRLRDELGIRVKNAWEGDCFRKATCFMMENLPDEQLFYPPLADETDEEGKDLTEKKMLGAMEERVDIASKEASKEEPALPGNEPYVIATLGSTFVFSCIDREGKIADGSMSPRGGRHFLGLGSLLSGAKTFEELIELAEAGNDRTVNIYNNDFLKDAQGGKGDSVYSLMEYDTNVFGFGWAVGKTPADFKREDLVRALLVNQCNEVINTAFMLAKHQPTKKIILCGSFAQSELPRRLMEKEFLKHKSMISMFNPKSPLCESTLRTLYAGGFLGAIGALLRSIDHTPTRGETLTKQSSSLG